MTDKKNRTNNGWHEKRDISGRAPLHAKAALKNKFDKEHISKEVAITPAGNEQEEKTLTLYFKDSDKFIDAALEFEEKYDTPIPFDFEEDRFISSVSKEMGDMFRNFMKDKGLEEIPEANVIETKESEKQQADDIIAEVQNERSKRAVGKDKSRTAEKVGNKENAGELILWVKNPGS
jgi:hypothetical protein